MRGETAVCRVFSPLSPDGFGEGGLSRSPTVCVGCVRSLTDVAERRLGLPFPGGDRRGVTPVPMPNTVVKPSTADGTARVTVWESRSLPGFFRLAH